MLRLTHRISNIILAALLLVLIFLISAVGVSETVLFALGLPTVFLMLLSLVTFIILKTKE